MLEEIKKQEDLESQQLREIEILREKLEQAKQNNASMLNQLNEKKRLGNVKDDQIKKLELKVRQMKSKIQAKREVLLYIFILFTKYLYWFLIIKISL